MTRLDRSLLREFVPVCVLTTALYVFLFLVQALLVRARWLGTLPVSALIWWLVYQVPSAALRALPLSMVMSLLLVLSRLVREQEFFAMQVAGLPLIRVLRPLVAFGVAVVITSLLLAEYVVPNANQRTTLTWWESVNGGGIALAFLSNRALSVGEYSLYFSSYDKPSRSLRAVRLERWFGNNHKQQFLCFASSATLETLRVSSQATLTLRDYACRSFDHNHLPLIANQASTDFITAETYSSGAYRIVLPQSRDSLIARNAEGGFEDPRAISQLWRDWLAGSEPTNRATGVELGTRTATAFAGLFLLLVVAPLAIVRGHSTGTALALALLVTVVYYTLVLIGQVLGQQGWVTAWFGPWLGNLCSLILGLGFWLALPLRQR